MLKNNERSAEWLRGQREALRTLLTRIGGKRHTMLATWGSYTATDVESIIREELDILAAAEAREAAESTVAGLRQALKALLWWFDEDHEPEREAVRIQREDAGVRWTSDQWLAAVLDAMRKEKGNGHE